MASPLRVNTQEVHQAMMRSTLLTQQGVYQRAAESQRWEVTELRLTGLPPETDERALRRTCMGFGCQVVRVRQEINPVLGQSSGKAVVLLRHAPKTIPAGELLAALGRGGGKAKPSVEVRMQPVRGSQ